MKLQKIIIIAMGRFLNWKLRKNIARRDWRSSDIKYIKIEKEYIYHNYNLTTLKNNIQCIIEHDTLKPSIIYTSRGKNVVQFYDILWLHLIHVI